MATLQDTDYYTLRVRFLTSLYQYLVARRRSSYTLCRLYLGGIWRSSMVLTPTAISAGVRSPAEDGTGNAHRTHPRKNPHVIFPAHRRTPDVAKPGRPKLSQPRDHVQTVACA